MPKNMKTRKGKDGFNYPYTSPDLVIDKSGKSNTKKFEEINTQLGNIAKQTVIEDGKLYLVKGDGTKLDQGTNIPLSTGSVDLSNYQQKTDNTLSTIQKEIPKAINEVNDKINSIETDLQNVVIYNPDDTNEDFITADNIAFSDSNFTATNVKGAISELFQSASNGKQLIANAITGKGIPTNKNDSFQTMATNIGNIQNGGTGITPVGTKEISENGTYDVTNFASVVVNVQSGEGSNIENGTITPSKNLDTITFNTSKKCSNIIIYKTSSTLTPSGVRQIALYACINNNIQRCIATNANGTAWASNYLSDSNPNSNAPRTVFNDSSIVVYSNSSLGGSGYYAKGEEYTWIAW